MSKQTQPRKSDSFVSLMARECSGVTSMSRFERAKLKHKRRDAGPCRAHHFCQLFVVILCSMRVLRGSGWPSLCARSNSVSPNRCSLSTVAVAVSGRGIDPARHNSPNVSPRRVYRQQTLFIFR